MRSWKMAGALSVAGVAALCLPFAAAAQVEAASDDDFKDAPPQFRSELSGGRLKPTQDELVRPLVNARPPLADPRDMNGMYSALRRASAPPMRSAGQGPGDQPPAGAPPGAGPGGGPPPGGAAAPGGQRQRNVGARACVYRAFPGLTSYSTTILINDRVAFLLMEENHPIRWARFDARHDPAVAPNYSGDSIARWDGNTLVIDTDKIRSEGSDQLRRVVERLTKQPDGNISIERFEVAADGTETKIESTGLRWRPDLRYVEDICEDFGEAFGAEYK